MEPIPWKRNPLGKVSKDPLANSEVLGRLIVELTAFVNEIEKQSGGLKSEQLDIVLHNGVFDNPVSAKSKNKYRGFVQRHYRPMMDFIREFDIGPETSIEAEWQECAQIGRIYKATWDKVLENIKIEREKEKRARRQGQPSPVPSSTGDESGIIAGEEGMEDQEEVRMEEEMQKRKDEEEAERKRNEEMEKKRKAEEAARKRKEEEDQKKKAEEAERKRKEEEEQKKKAEEAERKRKEEEEQKKKSEEAERNRKEEEQKRKTEEGQPEKKKRKRKTEMERLKDNFVYITAYSKD